MAQQHTQAAGSGKQTLTDFQRYEIGELSYGPAVLAELDKATGSSPAAWDGTPRVAEFITQERKVFGFSLFGWRFEAYRERKGGAA